MNENSKLKQIEKELFGSCSQHGTDHLLVIVLMVFEIEKWFWLIPNMDSILFLLPTRRRTFFSKLFEYEITDNTSSNHSSASKMNQLYIWNFLEI